MTSNLDQAVAIIEQAKAEIADLRHQFDQQRVALHQTTARLQREQERARGLDEQVADLELRLEQEQTNHAQAVAATLSHAARTS